MVEITVCRMWAVTRGAACWLLLSLHRHTKDSVRYTCMRKSRCQACFGEGFGRDVLHEWDTAMTMADYLEASRHEESQVKIEATTRDLFRAAADRIDAEALKGRTLVNADVWLMNADRPNST